MLGASGYEHKYKAVRGGLTTHKGCLMSDSSFVVKLALIKIMIKPAKLHYTQLAAWA